MTISQRTRVFLTVDVECAEERLLGDALQPARGYDLRVWGRLRNQTHELGVPLIVEHLAEVGLEATFFVEPFGSSYFGEAGLAEVCRYLREHGHDVQVHAHPTQRCIDWHTRNEARLADDMAAYPLEVQIRLLREAMAILGRCGIPRPSLRAFRAGNFGASNATWRAMAAVGLRLSCNFNLNYLDKRCRILWPTPANALFDTRLGVHELPVTNFADGGGYRHLQISAVSFSEMRHALLEAARLGLPQVTVVTHPFEFFLIDSDLEGTGRPNALNIERLRQLCEFLRERSDLFVVDTVGALAERLEQGTAQPERTLVPEGRLALRCGRFAEQAYKRLAARLPL